LSDSARLDEVRAAAQELSETDLSILQDFVPYRFLTLWLRSALVGVNDHSRYQLIQLLAARNAHSPRSTPYSFDAVIGRPKQIVVSSRWLTFLQSNQGTHLLGHDSLAAASSMYLFERAHPSGLRLGPLFAVEFIHPRLDYLIWNLTPAPSAINLAKSDAVPHLSRYLAAFVDQHYAAMPALKSALANVRCAQLRALEAITLEYATFFKTPLSELFLLSRDRYTDVLSTELHAQAYVARRLNFQTDWIWA
jgi:hypothetical protein